jgi:hypothetical protein
VAPAGFGCGLPGLLGPMESATVPLEPGKSKAAFSHNIAAERSAGKPEKQAVAIAYSEQRRTGKVGVRAKKVGHTMKHTSHSANTPNAGSQVRHEDGDKLVAKAVKIGVRATGSSKQPDAARGIKAERTTKVESASHRPPLTEHQSERPGVTTSICTLCGGRGHSAASHGSVKDAKGSTYSGPAVKQNHATQFAWNNGSPLTTGNATYRSPGYEGGMS